MGRRAAILCVLLFCGLFGCKGKPAAETKIPQEEVDRKNPIESNPASIADGQRLYGATDCALCHGKLGDGKGVLAKDINMNLHDWRKPESLANSSVTVSIDYRISCIFQEFSTSLVRRDDVKRFP